MIKKEIKMQCWKGFINVNISNGLLFFERYSFITERCVQTNFHNAHTRVIQFVCTHRRSHKTTSFERGN